MAKTKHAKMSEETYCSREFPKQILSQLERTPNASSSTICLSLFNKGDIKELTVMERKKVSYALKRLQSFSKVEFEERVENGSIPTKFWRLKG